ncbi:MAG TPA: replication initiator [Acidimicrobiales bacterium]|nr:replication initiator [Acidimicrobiales bacterium]
MSGRGRSPLDHRLREGELEHLELPGHLRAIVETAWRLGGDPELVRLRRWAHSLGYCGHLMTKSRRYSTTFQKLRAARQAWRLEEEGTTLRPESTPPLHWSFEGVGYRCRIDALLARTAAENRSLARREYWEATWATRGAP